MKHIVASRESMRFFLRYPLQPLPLANHLCSLVITRRLSRPHHGRQQQLHFSTVSSDSISIKQCRAKRKNKSHPTLQSPEVPDYLIPLAYRQPQSLHKIKEEREKKGHAKYHDSSPTSSKRGSGGGFASLFSRSSSPTSSPRTHHSTNNSPSRHRRRGGSYSHQPQKNNSHLSQSLLTKTNNIIDSPLLCSHQSRHPIVDVETLSKMEDSLNKKLSEYIKERDLGGSRSTDITTTTTPETSSNGHLYHYTPIMDSKFYSSLVIDYHSIVLGWCEIAEAICVAQRVLNSKGQGYAVTGAITDTTTSSKTARIADEEVVVEDTSSSSDVLEPTDAERKEDLLSKYEDAMCRAMRHLDSLEGLYHMNWTSLNPSAFDEKGKTENELSSPVELRGMTVMDDFASLMGNLLFGSKRDSTNTASADNNDIASSPTSKQQSRDAMEKDVGSDITSQLRIGDVQLITSLYEHILLAHHSSFCFGDKVRQKSTYKSNQLLKKWIPLYFCSSPLSSETSSNSHFHAEDSCPSNTESRAIYSGEYEGLGAKNIFHTVIRQNVDPKSSNDGVKQAEYWLSSMHSLAQAGYSNCAPDVDTYNLVLLGYCNLCKTVLYNRSNNSKASVARTRKFIIEGVERVLLQLVERKEESCSVNITSLNLVLNALVKAGQDSPELICQKTNNLLLKLVGEEKYKSIVKIESHDDFINRPFDDCSDDVHSNGSSDSASQINLEPNLDTYHWLVTIYSTSSDIANIMRSLSLLRRMIQIRNKESQVASASFAPSTRTYCNVLRALLAKVDELSDDSITKIAKENTQFLDSMVLHGSSLPNHVVYRTLLMLWQRSFSPEAGQYAEELVSRMEISGMYNNDLKISSEPYFLALSCWLTSATAGRLDAAERAYRLVNIMEARIAGDDFCSSSRSELSKSDDEDKSSDPQIQMYSEMLRICAATHKNPNSLHAVSIAFEIYDRMIQANIKPGPRTFESIYKCVINFVDHHPEAERQALLRKVYDIAGKHGMSRGELFGRYKASLRRIHAAGKAGHGV